MIDWTNVAAQIQAAEAKNKPDDYDWVLVDLPSLEQYIEWSHKKSNLKKRLSKAESIYEIAEQFRINERYARLPQQRTIAESGRCYYTGTNLQHCPSDVRRAALGDHHGYDLRSSVYSWQIVTLRQLDDLGTYDRPDGTSYTRELIADKDGVRNRLAALLTDTAPEQRLPAVKQAITAIGFGARGGNTYYDKFGQLNKQGVAGSIRMVEDCKRFLEDNWVKNFIAEQKLIGRRIVAGYLELMPELAELKHLQHNTKFSPKKFLAYAYQSFETKVIQSVMAHPDVANREVLLWVHDCFYTRKSINLADINGYIMMEFGDGIQLEHSHDSAWTKKASTEQDIARERAERHRAEREWHRSQGRDSTTEYTECQPIPRWRPADEVPLGTYLGYK
jgi:hypothetical protein